MRQENPQNRSPPGITPATAQPAESPAQTPQEAPSSPKKAAIANTPLIDYLSNFWTPNSEYAQFKRDVQKHPLTPYYIEMNHDDVRRHVEPFPGFSGVTVGTLTKATLKKWLIWLAGRKAIRHKKDGTAIEGNTLSGRRANAVLQSVRVAVRWAVDNEEIGTDPFRKLGEVSESIKEKGVLTFEERERLTELPVSDYRSRLVMALGSFCGLRRGEMRGLQWGDIADGVIHIRHNWQEGEGLKPCKCGSEGYVPMMRIIAELVNEVHAIAPLTGAEDFVMSIKPYHPICREFLSEALRHELSLIGIDEGQRKARNIVYHSLRHSFVTACRIAGLSDFETMSLSRHKDVKMLQRYSHGKEAIDVRQIGEKMEQSLYV